jgi:SAM-dependent methyltransferase
MAVIDLCCGDGYFTAPLALLIARKVLAIDLDATMLERARAEAERQGAPACEWIRGDARDLAGLVPGPVDYVLLANTFHGVPRKTALARGVADALRPGGRFGIVNWHRLPRERTVVLGRPRGPRTAMRMSPEQVRQSVEPAGFRFERLVELPPYHYGAIFAKG